MKVAITGASGYVGGCIADGFRRNGHEVLAMSRRPCPEPWVPYSLTDEPNHLPWNGVEMLIHAAFDFTPRTLEESIERNVKPSIALLEAAHQAGVERLLFISSMSAFDGCRSHYGRAKRMIEERALELGIVVVRPGLVWGERSGGVMGAMEKLVAKSPVIPFLTGGSQLNQYLIHEADLADAVVSLADFQPTCSGKPHSVAHPAPVSFSSMLKTIAGRSNLSRIYVPVPWRIVMAMLKFIEALNISTPFRSDSLTGLVHGNAAPEIGEPTGVRYRQFQ
jgi:nucleoside-diphosphate-sugar epimerase